MKLQEFSEIKRDRGPGEMLFFPRIPAGKYKVSAQAGKYNYCNPQVEFEILGKYESIEIAIFLDNKWVLPKTELPQFTWSKEFEGGGQTSVRGWVPIKEVVQIINDLAGESTK